MQELFVGEYEIRTIKVAVGKRNQPLFSECMTTVEIVGEPAGEYLTVTQQSYHVDAKSQQIMIEDSDWESLKAAIEMMLASCRE